MNDQFWRSANKSDRLFIALAWLTALAVLFIQLGSAPLTDLDEGAFSEASREMLIRGDFISPWLLDTPRFDKPVLTHWAQMLGFELLGLNAWGARLHSALAGLVWIGAIGGWAYLIAQRLSLGQPVEGGAALRAYGWAVLISATCLGIPAMSRAATADALLNAWLAMSLLFVWKSLFTDKSPSSSERKSFRWATVFIGLGLLTKGPIAVLVPGAAALLASLVTGRLLRLLRLVADPWVWLIPLAIAGPWYVLQFQAQGMAFIEGFLGLHNLGRFTQTMHGFSAGPLYYPGWMLIASLPWLPLVVFTLWKGLRFKLRHTELVLCWSVFLFVVVFFSFSATKLPHYGFYGLSGLIVLMAILAAGGVRLLNGRPPDDPAPGASLHLVTFIFAALCAAGLALLPVWFADATAGVTDAYYALVLADAAERFEDLTWAFGLMGLMVTVGVVMTIAITITDLSSSNALDGRHLAPANWLPACLPIWLAATTFAIGLHGLVVPTIMKSLREPIREIATAIRTMPVDGPQAPHRIITWRLTAPSLSFEAQRVISAGTPQPGDWVVLHAKDLAALERETTCNRGDQKFKQLGIAVIVCR